MMQDRKSPGVRLFLLERIRKLLMIDSFERFFLITLLVVNILGSIYGYYWYGDQLASTPVLWWLFVPDSPLSTSLFSVSLVFFLFHKTLKFVPLLALGSLIKYGLWAVVINMDLLVAGEGFSWLNLMLSLSHLGMAGEGIIFLRQIKFSVEEIFLLSVWFICQDYVDYVIGLHPFLFSERQFSLAQSLAVILSVSIIVLVVAVKKRLFFTMMFDNFHNKQSK